MFFLYSGHWSALSVYMLSISIIVLRVCDNFVPKVIRSSDVRDEKLRDVRSLLSSIFLALLLVCLLISKPHNVVLVAFQLLMMASVDELERCAILSQFSHLFLVSLWMANACFFFQVNSINSVLSCYNIPILFLIHLFVSVLGEFQQSLVNRHRSWLRRTSELQPCCVRSPVVSSSVHSSLVVAPQLCDKSFSSSSV